MCRMGLPRLPGDEALSHCACCSFVPGPLPHLAGRGLGTLCFVVCTMHIKLLPGVACIRIVFYAICAIIIKTFSEREKRES